MAPLKVELSAVVEEASPVPAWLLTQAHRAAAEAAREGAGHYEVLNVLLLVTLAAEAILNRLLEPLVDPVEWNEGKGKARALERQPAADKWLRLSKELGLEPPLSRGSEPLQGFLRTVEARNALVHFKHGKNVRKLITEPLPLDLAKGKVSIPISTLLARRERMVAAGEVDEVLNLGNAEHYYASLVAMLEPVLAAYPKDRFSTASFLKEALGGTLVFGRSEDALPDN